LTQSQYSDLLNVSDKIDWRFRLALILAHETGHRIGSIRKLMWSDIDLEGVRIHWRADDDKIGFDHKTPMSEVALHALMEEQWRNRDDIQLSVQHGCSLPPRIPESRVRMT